jgi:hypothetical protein
MGYSPESSKKLAKLHSELIQKMLQSFENEAISILKFRRQVFFDLLQNDKNVYRTHTGVFNDLVDEGLAPRKLNPLKLTDITSYLKTTLNMYLDNSGERPGLVMYDLIHDSDDSVLEFAHNVLLPLMEELGIENLPEREPMVDFGDGSPLEFPIAERIRVEGNVKFGTETETERALLRRIYDKFDEFAKANPDMTINDLKYLSSMDFYTNLTSFLDREIKMLEFGNMYTAVPGTEGVRPALHIIQSMLDSIDEIAPSLSKNQLDELVDLIDEFDMQDFIGFSDELEQDYGKTKLNISDYVDVTDTPAVDKTKRIQFIKDKLAQYMDDFVEQANAYLTSSDDLITNGFSYVTYKRGQDAKRFRETFKVGFIESGIVDLEILLKNSADPVGFLHSLHDAHAAGNVTESFPPYVSEKLLASLNQKYGLNTAGMLNTSRFLGQMFEGVTIGELAAEVFNYPNRPDFYDITPIITKLEKYDNYIDDTGSVELQVNPDSPQNLIFEDDVVVYHSRPAETGPLPSDANFHAGTYQAAMDRASYFYEGQSMHEMLGETLVELDENLNAVLNDINPLEDYDTTFAADYGTTNNRTEIIGHLEYTADEGHLEIRYSIDGEWVDGNGYPIIDEYYDVEDISTLKEISGDLSTADYIDAETIFEKLPLGPGSEFQWAKGYDIYEISIPKDATVLNLDAPISVVQRRQEITISGDMLQEAIENGLNTGLDPTYDDITEITIGNKTVSIDDRLTPKAIEELVFGSYDVVAYQNNIEDVGSTSYIIKPNSRATVRALTGPKRRLFNNRVIRAFVSNNPFFFGESFFDNKRKIETILGLVEDDRKQDVQTILEFYKKVANGEEGLETSVEKANLDKLFVDDFDTPTNVADDFYVVTPEQLSNAIEEIRKSFGDTLPEIQFESHLDFINQLEQTLMTQGFQEKVGGELDDLRVVLDDWLTGGGTFEDTKFFNNFPKLENLPDPQNIRGFVAAAGGPEEIKEGYVIPQYFKDKPNVPYVDTPTNVDGNLTEYAVDDVTRKQDLQVPEEALKRKGFKTVDVPGPKKVATLEIDGILHARPTSRLGMILQNSPEELYLMTPDGLVEANTLNVLKLGRGPFEVFTYDQADAPTAFQYLEENAGLFYKDDVALDEVSFSVKKPVNPRGVEFGPVDELDKAIASSDGVENLNKAKAVIRNNPGVFRKVLNVVEKLDIGDQVIQQVLKRAFPRIGLSALAGPVGIAYALYETALLLSDVGNAAYQAQTTDESFWDNFGEVSDKYSIAYKISKPVYDTLFEAVKADLEDDDTLYLLGR